MLPDTGPDPRGGDRVVDFAQGNSQEVGEQTDRQTDRQTDLDLDLDLILFRARVSIGHQLEATNTGVNEMQDKYFWHFKCSVRLERFRGIARDRFRVVGVSSRKGIKTTNKTTKRGKRRRYRQMSGKEIKLIKP